MFNRALFAGMAIAILVAAGAPAQEPKQPAAPPGTKTEAKAETLKPNLGGFLQLDYRLGDDAGRHSAVAHEFMLRRARLAVSGKANDRISYSATLQVESSSTAVLEAFIDYTVNPFAKVRAGQYKYDFDLAGRESSAALTFLDRPFATNSVAGSLNGASTASTTTSNFRDRGVTLFGDTTGRAVNWGYSIGVFQGAGRASDTNDAFGYVANVRAYPLKALRLNAGYLSSDAAPKGDARTNQYDAWTAGMTYEHAVGTLTGEYYSGQRDKGTTDESVSGYYLSAAYRVHPKMDVMGRYQTIEDDRFASGTNGADSVDAGVRWYFIRKGPRSGTHLSLNYMSRSADAGFEGLTLLNDGKGPAIPNGTLVKDVIAMRLQVQF